MSFSGSEESGRKQSRHCSETANSRRFPVNSPSFFSSCHPRKSRQTAFALIPILFLFALPSVLPAAEKLLLHVECQDILPRKIIQERIRDAVASLPRADRPEDFSIGPEDPGGKAERKPLSLHPVRSSEENMLLYVASGILFAVSPKSELRELSFVQAKSLADGVLTAWEEQDEQGKTVRKTPVIVCIPEEDGESLIPAPPGTEDETPAQIRVRFPNGETLIRYTEENPDAVALLPLSFPARYPNGLRILAVGGIYPDRKNILNRKYPFSTLYGLICRERIPAALAAEESLTSKHTAEALFRAGMIPLFLKEKQP